MLASVGADVTDLDAPFKVWTPAEIKAEMAQTSAYFDSVKRELSAFLADRKPTDTKGKENLLWLKFQDLFTEWVKFLKDDPSTWFVGTVDKCRKFRARAGAVIEMLNLWGWKTVTKVPEKEGDKQKPKTSILPVLAATAVSALIIGVLVSR